MARPRLLRQPSLRSLVSCCSFLYLAASPTTLSRWTQACDNYLEGLQHARLLGRAALDTTRSLITPPASRLQPIERMYADIPTLSLTWGLRERVKAYQTLASPDDVADLDLPTPAALVTIAADIYKMSSGLNEEFIKILLLNPKEEADLLEELVEAESSDCEDRDNQTNMSALRQELHDLSRRHYADREMLRCMRSQLGNRRTEIEQACGSPKPVLTSMSGPWLGEPEENTCDCQYLLHLGNSLCEDLRRLTDEVDGLGLAVYRVEKELRHHYDISNDLIDRAGRICT